MADPNPNEEGDAVNFHLNGDIIAHHSRGDVEIDHVRTSLALARQQDTGLSARKAILEVSELSIIKAPDFRQPGKPLDLGKYRNYMPAVWGHCSDGAVDPVRVCRACENGRIGFFQSCVQVEGDDGFLWDGACTSCFAPGNNKNCSFSANYDAQYRKKRKATNDQGQDEIGSAEPGDRAIRKRRREIREETQTLMTDMADMAVRLDQLRREDLNLEGQLDAERE
ncbi:uncharacterized protein BKA78DRAFT_298603 [Phyllosticta capitalensis]|uniref:uncharacterized protein n=1 Tax=Phyllosticta capitalensis TaxID=121624 RepID=UPI00312E3CDD